MASIRAPRGPSTSTRTDEPPAPGGCARVGRARAARIATWSSHGSGAGSGGLCPLSWKKGPIAEFPGGFMVCAADHEALQPQTPAATVAGRTLSSRAGHPATLLTRPASASHRGCTWLTKTPTICYLLMAGYTCLDRYVPNAPFSSRRGTIRRPSGSARTGAGRETFSAGARRGLSSRPGATCSANRGTANDDTPATRSR